MHALLLQERGSSVEAGLETQLILGLILFDSGSPRRKRLLLLENLDGVHGFLSLELDS